MKAEFGFIIQNLPPMPRNQSHALVSQRIGGGKTVPRMIKTPMALAFEKDLEFRLRKCPGELFAGYDWFKYTLISGIPSNEFWTAKGQVSKTSVDFDAHKMFTDTVARVHKFNDGQICEHHFLKVPVEGPQWHFAVKIESYNSKEKAQTCTLKDFLTTLSSHGFQTL
jgi:hypothetical protein